MSVFVWITAHHFSSPMAPEKEKKKREGEKIKIKGKKKNLDKLPHYLLIKNYSSIFIANGVYISSLRKDKN